MYGLSAHQVPPNATPAKNGASHIIHVGRPNQTVEIKSVNEANQNHKTALSVTFGPTMSTKYPQKNPLTIDEKTPIRV